MTAAARRTDVLIYGMNYAPELTGIGRYTGELADGLARSGRQVDVITTPPHYPGWYVREPYRAGTYAREDSGGITVFRCPILLYKAGRGLGRLAAPLAFALSSAPIAIWRILSKRPRAILCVEPTLFVAPAALLAGWWVGARTVLHVQDLEIDAAFAVGHLKAGGIAARLAYRFELFLISRFDHVVTISTQMAQRLRQKGVAEQRLSIIRNWVDTAKIYPLGRPSSYRDELGLGPDDFVVLYSGQIGAKQALHILFETAERMRADERVQFVVAGEGPLKQAFVERYGQLPNLRILGLQPEDRLNEFLNLADCHILPQDPVVQDLVLPSKLGGMLASGKSIVVTAEDGCELAEFLKGAARIVPAGDVEALAACLRDELDTLKLGNHAGPTRAAVLSASDAFESFDCTLLSPSGSAG